MNLYPCRYDNMSLSSAFEAPGVFHPSLPEHCDPSTPFLRYFSSVFHTCVPTPLAFTSTLLGSLSIVAWLFAQLPQIWKNYRLHSTSGLSIFFLGEWLLGDLSNLIGSVLTQQATWQVVLASYYCFVDVVLVCQWFWYELLKHGRPLRSVWSKRHEPKSDGKSGVPEVIEGMSVHAPSDDNRSTSSKPIDTKRLLPSNHPSLFRTPRYASPPASLSTGSPSSVSSQTPRRPVVIRPGTSPTPSPRTVLLVCTMLAILTPIRASPLSTSHPAFSNPLRPSPLASTESEKDIAEIAGQLISWLSTLCYLGSRIPQLVKNHTRRSTSGLSPTLFAAAFTGNLFYSTSLLTNPCAWQTFPPHGGRGWVGSDGSIQGQWVALATPFFLGAAGVLLMDAMVGIQFWYFGEGNVVKPTGEEAIVVVEEDASGDEGWVRTWRWRRVDGWMRGWVPSVSVAGTPRTGTSRAPSVTSGRMGEDETESLLGEEGGKGRAYGGV